MILASHQPNFLPYLGYAYKMYCCDVFTFSSGVEFTRSGFHNYNFIEENGQRAKLTVPVKSHSGRICDVEIADEWEKKKKAMLKRISFDYHRSPFFKEVYPLLENVIGGTYIHLAELNKALLVSIHDYYGMTCQLEDEMLLLLDYESPNEDIVAICTQLGASSYLSGTGAKEYLNPRLFEDRYVRLLWSNYCEEDYGSLIKQGSILDYMMLKGRQIPESWKRDKEAYHGKDL